MEASAAEVVAAGLFGAVIGSFLNVVAHRVPLGESLVSPPSRCPECEAPVKPYDNVPVLSWLLLRGRMIPAALAWLGVIASLLLVVVLPLQLARLLDGPITSLVWLPMLAFEDTVGVWFIVKGVSPTRATPSP